MPADVRPTLRWECVASKWSDPHDLECSRVIVVSFKSLKQNYQNHERCTVNRTPGCGRREVDAFTAALSMEDFIDLPNFSPDVQARIGRRHCSQFRARLKLATMEAVAGLAGWGAL